MEKLRLCIFLTNQLAYFICLDKTEIPLWWQIRLERVIFMIQKPMQCQCLNDQYFQETKADNCPKCAKNLEMHYLHLNKDFLKAETYIQNIQKNIFRSKYFLSNVCRLFTICTFTYESLFLYYEVNIPARYGCI